MGNVGSASGALRIGTTGDGDADEPEFGHVQRRDMCSTQSGCLTNFRFFFFFIPQGRGHGTSRQEQDWREIVHQVLEIVPQHSISLSSRFGCIQNKVRGKKCLKACIDGGGVENDVALSNSLGVGPWCR